MNRALSIIILVTVPLGMFCAGARQGQDQPSRILIAHEKVYIAPLEGLETLRALKGWPTEFDKMRALQRDLFDMRAELVTEFRRCEKYGMYTIVDTLQAPTVVIIPALAFNRISADTLYMPLHVAVENRATDKLYNLEIDAWGIFESVPDSVPTLYQLGHALGSYRRDFPYRKFVSLFYPERTELPADK